jgi:hypothetical protein
VTEVSTVGALPPEFERNVSERFDRACADDVIERIRRHDGTLWAPLGAAEVVERLGWLDVADRMAAGQATVAALRGAITTLTGSAGPANAAAIGWRCPLASATARGGRQGPTHDRTTSRARRSDGTGR